MAAFGGSPRAIRCVLVLVNAGNTAATRLVEELEPWLVRRGIDVRLEADGRAFGRARIAGEKTPGAPADLLIVVGGDGALLGAVRAFADEPIPTLGIHFGRVGFLASTTASHWRETLEAVLEGRGRLEQRMRLSARCRGGRGIALNEVVLQRGVTQGMLTVGLRVERDWVTNYRADGLIVATPSGSTAYSLSAGGPILSPALDAFVVTPISPQGLANRPIVLEARGELLLSVAQSDGPTTLVLDGQEYVDLDEGDVVAVERHPLPWPLYAMEGLDPYRRLRDRLGWRGGIEPDVFGSF